MRVLLVDDNEDFRQLLTKFLNRNGFVVQGAAGGREALDWVGEFQPDLVLTDVRMPELDGIELIRQLREIPSLRRVPMIACTADVGTRVDRLAREAGASDVIGKPVDLFELVDRLNQCLRRPFGNR
ncbi:response regulator [Singulisphaera rosea]